MEAIASINQLDGDGGIRHLQGGQPGQQPLHGPASTDTTLTRPGWHSETARMRCTSLR